jgi:hypothetical protein
MRTKDDLIIDNEKIEISEQAEYGKIVLKGELHANAPFSAEYIDIAGGINALHFAKLVKGSVNGPINIKGELKTSVLTTNGPTDVYGMIIAENELTCNAPLMTETGIQGLLHTHDALLTFNDDVETPEISFADKLIVNGRLKAEIVNQIRHLKIRGSAFVDNINCLEDIIIDLLAPSKIGKIKGGDIEIGKDLKNSKLREYRQPYFKNDADKYKPDSDDQFLAQIGDIHSAGVVELDHVKVNNVYAYELYIGENVEIVGEFMQVPRL